MADYQEVRFKLIKAQLNKLKSSVKNNTGTTLRITPENFQDDEMPHELFLTARQKTKVRNTFANNMSTDKKLSKSQLAKIIQSGEFLGKLDLAVPLAKDVLPKLATKATLSAIDKLEK